MQVMELIELLQQQDPDADVKFCYNYGDYWKTTVAEDIQEVDEGLVEHSSYHDMDKVLDEDNGKNEYRKVVLIRG